LKHKPPVRFFIFGAVIIDAALILSADLLAFWLRYGIDVQPRNLEAYKTIAVPIILLRLSCLYIFGLYEKPKYKTNFDNFCNIVKAMTISALIIGGVAFFARAFAYPRTVILLSWFITSILIFVWRVIARWLINAFMGRDYFISRILIIGADQDAFRLMLHMTGQSAMKCRLVGYISTGAGKTAVPKEQILGSITDIPALIRRMEVDEVVISSPGLPRDTVARIFSYFINTDIIFKTVPDLYETVIGKVAATSASKNVPLVELTTMRYGRGWYSGFKRVTDIAVSSLAVLFAGPFLMAPIAAIIKCTSRGPVFHKQERAGLHCRPFTMLKFRTMDIDCEKETGPVWASKDDGRVIRFGRFLRKSHLDELPQFFNVLRGDMSVVGPRPERPYFVQSLMAGIPFYAERLELKPGITGWSQVNLNYAGDVESNEQKLLSDLYYIENMSISLDVWIMFKTIQAILSGKGV